MEFIVDKDNLNNLECRTSPRLSLGDKQILVKVDKFAFTSNNLTYANVGDKFGYFSYYPVIDESSGTVDTSKGIIPVWGIGTVVASRCENISEGEKFYGFLPMAGYCVMTPTRVNASGFTDGVEYRQNLPPVYSNYNRCSTDPLYKKEFESFMCLNRPLYLTAFILDDFFDDNNFFGADAVVIASASSKTSYCLAHELKTNNRGKKIIGLTSSKNVKFTESLGVYNQVIAYGDLEKEASKSQNTVYIDMSGNMELLGRVHSVYGGSLKYSCMVGQTHWDKTQGLPEGLQGPEPTLFFAPSQFEKRTKEWGAEQLGMKMGVAWERYAKHAVSNNWCAISEHVGAAKIRDVYNQFLNGSVDPKNGFICSFWDQAKM